MPIEITVPRLGWSMEEGTFSAWLKKDGEFVAAGELLFALESEKATQEIESLDSGILRIPPDAPKQGDTVKVGQVLGYLVADGEGVREKAEVARQEAGGRRQEVEAEVSSFKGNAAVESGQAQRDSERVAISPRARRVAAELGVDWSQVRGSGRTGRIRESDIRAAAIQPKAMAGLTATRRTIADRMMQSLRQTAPVTLHTSADATALVELRQRLKSAATDAQPMPGYTEMLLLIAARALKEHPALNARWENGSLVQSAAAHIGLAVDTEAGLLVPVIRDVAALALGEIASRSRELIQRARARQLAAEELRGGTFTITSLGAFGIDAFTPIINHPEVAILGVGRIQRQPAVVNDAIVARDILSLSLTFDHRALDGAPAARFLQTLRQLIEQFTPASTSPVR